MPYLKKQLVYFVKDYVTCSGASPTKSNSLSATSCPLFIHKLSLHFRVPVCIAPHFRFFYCPLKETKYFFYFFIYFLFILKLCYLIKFQHTYYIFHQKETLGRDISSTQNLLCWIFFTYILVETDSLKQKNNNNLFDKKNELITKIIFPLILIVRFFFSRGDIQNI